MRLSVEGQAKGQARKHAANLDNRGPAPARGTAGAAAELSARRDPELHVGPVGDDRAPDTTTVSCDDVPRGGVILRS